MNCKICFSNFNLYDQSKLPRVLIKCGHTFCDQCIRNKITQSNEFVCQQCGKISELNQSDNFPLNQTLIGILKENTSHIKNQIKQNQCCKTHGRKLQAYCQSDGVILCLQCLLTEHKSHKVVSIDEKVHKQKQMLKSCFESMLKSEQSLQRSSDQCVSLIDKLRLDLDEYVFQINFTCKNIVSQLKEIQHNFIHEAKKTIQKSIEVANSTQNMLKDKQHFYEELKNIYHQLNFKQGVNFLQQLNTSLFITQNSTLKQKFSLPYQKISLKKQKLLNQFLNSIQQLLNFEKKKNSIANPNKMSTNDLNNSSIQKNIKNDNKVKSRSKNESFSKSIEESPLRQPKKSLASIQKLSRQPQILQVNLVEKYERHQQAKNMKKKTSDIQVTNKGKSTRIEYEVKRQLTIGKDKNKLQVNRCDSFRDEPKSNTSANKQKILIDLQSSARLSMINKSNQKSLMSNKFSSSQIGDFTTSFLNQTYFIGSPDCKKQQPFESQTPFSIKSFMESSQFTITQEKKDETVLKDSRSSFTMFNFEQKIYHFGGLRNNSISCLKINPGQASQIKIQSEKVVQGLSRSKSQCVVMKSYNAKKCLILGGKDENGQRTKSILQFDLTSKKVSKSHLQLIEPISGFGAVTNDSKLYIFGGSSFTALKTLQQYRVQKNGFEMRKLSSMINSRDELGFAMGYDGYLYVAGGINSSNIILNSCERYCFKTNKWTSISAMKTPRRSFVMVSLPNGLYVIGGHDGKQFLKSVQMYDFDLQKWVDICPLNQPRFTHTAVTTSDYQHIIVCGGYETAPLKSVEIYNVIQQKWTKIQGVDDERYLHCSILVQD